MRIVRITELVYADPRPKSPEEGKVKHDAILAELNAPVYLGVFSGIQYDLKSDRYAASFSPGEGKKLTLKATDTVTAFLAEHTTGKGYWLGRMEAGTREAGALVDVYLIQA